MTVGMVSGQSRESSLPPLIQTTTTRDDAEPAFVGPRLAITPGPTATMSTSTSTSTTTTTTTVPGAPLAAPPSPTSPVLLSMRIPGAPSPQATAPPAATCTGADHGPGPSRATTSAGSDDERHGHQQGRIGGRPLRRVDGRPSASCGPRRTTGFTMNLQDTGPDKVEVRFESDDAESRVIAWWDGAPRQRVEETD